jgi:hypothetical protein
VWLVAKNAKSCFCAEPGSDIRRTRRVEKVKEAPFQHADNFLASMPKCANWFEEIPPDGARPRRAAQ